MSSLKSSESIRVTKSGSDRYVSKVLISSLIFNEQTLKAGAKGHTIQTNSDINPQTNEKE